MQSTQRYTKGVVAFFVYVVAVFGTFVVGFPEWKPPFTGLITAVATVTTLRYVKDWWLVDGTAEAAAGTLDPGSFVKVTGTAAPFGETQTAPDGTTCVFWRYVLQYRDHGTDTGDAWSAVGAGIGDPYFLVNDGTGEVVVDGEAEATYHIDANRVSGDGPARIRITEETREDPTIRAILDRHSPPSHGDLRLSVSRIEPGEDVLVIGRVDTMRDSDGREWRVLTRDPKRNTFIIGDAGEAHVSWMKRWAVVGHGLIALGAGYWTATLLQTHYPGVLPI